MLNSLLEPDAADVLTVKDLTRKIKRQLEGRFTRFWVRGEVSNVRTQSSGHIYFSLKDKDSQLPAVCFARDAALQSVQIEDGMELLLFGDLSVYEPHGRYQMIVKVVIQSGLGQLQIEYERLKRKLAAEGLFEADRKRPFPLCLNRIAVITSPSGAAIQDFNRILRRRNYKGEIVILPARVQGKEASGEIEKMLEYANNSGEFDLIVLTRGGGSIEDLWPFNTESLARAVASSSTPTLSAVGHEIDHVLTDYTADLRAETPSGAAELISSARLELVQRIATTHETLSELVESSVYELKTLLRDHSNRLKLNDPTRHLQMLTMRLDENQSKLSSIVDRKIRSSQNATQLLTNRLAAQHPKSILKLSERTVEDFSRRMQRAVLIRTKEQNSLVTYLEKRLNNTSLQSSLQRGFALLQKDDGSIISNADHVEVDESITARTATHRLKLTVTEKHARDA
jgi:exodeoxyribonuclease VII large subunit